MKKNLFNLIIILLLVISLTGCNSKKIKSNGNNEEKMISGENNLTCNGKFSLMMDVIIGKIGNASGANDITISLAPVDEINKYIEDGYYIFNYDDNKLISIKGKEIFKKSFSKELTDEQIEEENKKDNIKITKDSSGKIIIEYVLNDNDDLVKAFRNEKKLKERLEKDAGLVCNSNLSNIINSAQKEKILRCSGNVYYAYEEYNFVFKYNDNKQDYSLDSMYKYLTIPDNFNPSEYYTEEEMANSGRYEMSLNDKVITYKLDNTRSFWNDYIFKDYTFDALKAEFINDGYKCED